MARLGDNPLKTPLSGGELIAAEDPSTGNDICLTPSILQSYMAYSFALASGTGNGLMRSSDYTLLHSLYTTTQIDSFNAIFKKEVIGFYVGTVANGALEFLSNPMSELVLQSAYIVCNSGTVTCSVQIDGVSVTGMSLIAVSSVRASLTATALRTLATGGKLSLLFAANSSCLGFYISILAYKTFP